MAPLCPWKHDRRLLLGYYGDIHLLLLAIIFIMGCIGDSSNNFFNQPHDDDGNNNNININKKQLCQKIDIEMCKDLPYNFTSMPNLVGHDEQTEAELQLSTFAPLIQVQCSSRLKFFLCSLYVPMCTEKVKTAIGPCRPLCESVRSCCEPMLRQFGFPWPLSFNCSKFPVENNAETMCMIGPGYSTKHGEEASAATKTIDPCGRGVESGDLQIQQAMILSEELKLNDQYIFPNNLQPVIAQTSFYIESNKSIPAIPMTSLEFIPCHSSSLYTGTQMASARFLMMSLAGLTIFMSCIILILRWISASSMLMGPCELSLFYIVCCHGAASVSPMIRLTVGDTVACVEHAGNPGALVLVSGGLYSTTCAVIAVIYFYFSTAARFWWLAGCAALLFSGAHQANSDNNNTVPHTNFSRVNFYVHLIAWILPLIQTAVLLADQAVDADPLTGICSAGNQDRLNLLKFYIAPEIAYLLIGGCLMLLIFLKKSSNNRGQSSSSWCQKFYVLDSDKICKMNRGNGGLLRPPPPPTNLDPCFGALPMCCIYFAIGGSLIACYIQEFLSKKSSTAAAAPTTVYEIAVCKIIAQNAYGIILSVWYCFPTVATIKLSNNNRKGTMMPLSTTELFDGSTHKFLQDGSHVVGPSSKFYNIKPPLNKFANSKQMANNRLLFGGQQPLNDELVIKCYQTVI